MTQTAPHPRMHGLTHVPGGPDPIPLFPSSFQTYEDMIETEPALWAYWPLSDSSGLDFEETVAGRNLTGVESSPYVFTYGLPGPIVDDPGTSIGFTGTDSAVGTTDGTSASYQFQPDDDVELVLGGSSTFTVEVWLYPNVPVVENQSDDLTYLGTVFSVGDADFTHSALNVSLDADGHLKLLRGTTGEVAASADPVVDGWNHLAATNDGTTILLYLNGAVVATVAAGSRTVADGYRFQIGRQTYAGYSQYLEGRLAHAAIYTEPLDAATVAAHAAHTSGLDTTGWVPTSDGHGGVSLQPPGVEVTHGDEPADDTPVFGGIVTTGGPPWNPANHYEQAILFDSSPARFDVPSRTWVRVPFNQVRIWRTWETSDDRLLSAWLPDDRDAGAQADSGLLHVSADMAAGPQTVSGWYAIEYPVVDPDALPASGIGGIGIPDAYVRAVRAVNASTGTVLRTSPGNTYRRFVEWAFASSGGPDALNIAYEADNPYPIYPAWPARPLSIPLPYPGLSPTASLAYYLDPLTGEPGMLWWNYWIDETDLAAGANVCLQAWQDSPWLLRFTTDHFANYNPPNFGRPFQRRPFLSIYYQYDPDSIDHDTGLLL